MKDTALYIIFSFLFFSLLPIQAENTDTYMYRLILKDKGNLSFRLDKPEEFLSEKAIQRRYKQGIAIDTTDLPIDTAYLNRIAGSGASIKAMSKWVRTVTVELPDSLVLEKLKQLPFIENAVKVWEGIIPDVKMAMPYQKSEPLLKNNFNDVNAYGAGFTQISLLNGHLLHEAGFRGEGITIAVLDGGFGKCGDIAAFDQSRIRGVKNFTHLSVDPLLSDFDHGTSVLSCMLSDEPGVLIGTAPEADYYLLQTEVGGFEEFPVEEDYWIAGIEYADSIGVDIANTSLGYSTFNNMEMNHTQAQLDGNSLISMAASMATGKGMILLNAAGNEGRNVWKKITFPADAKNILTVGSVDSKKERSSFSSQGPTADGRIKPDIMSMGSSAQIIDSTGIVRTSNGTSFASPILAGMVACLWEALPSLSNKEIMNLLLKSGDRYAVPDTLYGYGIPDVYKAYTGTFTQIEQKKENAQLIYVSNNRLYINLSPHEASNCRLIIYNSLGGKVMDVYSLNESVDVGGLQKGVYIACVGCGDAGMMRRKFIKI